jgi:hypothetical protein
VDAGEIVARPNRLPSVFVESRGGILCPSAGAADGVVVIRSRDGRKHEKNVRSLWEERMQDTTREKSKPVNRRADSRPA